MMWKIKRKSKLSVFVIWMVFQSSEHYVSMKNVTFFFSYSSSETLSLETTFVVLDELVSVIETANCSQWSFWSLTTWFAWVEVQCLQITDFIAFICLLSFLMLRKMTKRFFVRHQVFDSFMHFGHIHVDSGAHKQYCAFMNKRINSWSVRKSITKCLKLKLVVSSSWQR